ncbi:MAG: diguanylate cyclase [Magnetococcales bacterium]|nr:diguanylate cyclase [Magnetococcales bacterium]
MRLQTKTTLLTLALLSSIVVILTIVSLLSFRQFSINTAKAHVRSAAEIVRVSLTESMINGVISERQQFLSRLAEVQGLLEARVVRGPHVVSQYGAGLEIERTITPDPIEQNVLTKGMPYYALTEEWSSPVFRATIPFIADAEGEPNCMACHRVSVGAVLGAITIRLSLVDLQRTAIVTISIMDAIMLSAALVMTMLFRWQLTPVVKTAQGVQRVVTRAKSGDFGGRIRAHTGDEVGQIARDLNRLMGHLKQSLSSITRDVARLMHYDLQGNTNLLATTTEMVETLVHVSQFKQAIEEDQTIDEVYARIARILKDHFDTPHFSIYEVDPEHNRMRVMFVDDPVAAPNTPCRWCDPMILTKADTCRAQRTGKTIDAVASPHICSRFLPNSAESDAHPNEHIHICIPVIHSGAVGSIIQIVMRRDHGRMFQLLTPFIAVYLRESAPVVEAKKLLAALRETVLRDPLTGLHNRRFLEEFVETMVATATRKQSRISVLMTDLDHFKEVNDTYGHDVGDDVLRAFAKVLTEQTRASDTVVRFGGEEFMVILQESAEFSGDQVAEKIRSAVERLKIPLPSGGTLKRTISIGLARLPTDSEDFWDVAKFADLALYKAKSEGRNQVVAYTEEICAVDNEIG